MRLKRAINSAVAEIQLPRKALDFGAGNCERD